MHDTLLGFSFFCIVTGMVFMHGQGITGWWSGKTRFIATVLVTAIISYASYLHIQDWRFMPLVIVSTAWAFDWGPEIGWNRDVMVTQIIKGLWLALAISPFGIMYGALRPLAYWIGYAKFTTPSDHADEVARILSGAALASCVFIAIIA